jgi:D-alanyl-D-alanine carboxypeptidase/D-alanyl-D-alanine-endopeptidase (penicillin-binding protein 4)
MSSKREMVSILRERPMRKPLCLRSCRLPLRAILLAALVPIGAVAAGPDAIQTRVAQCLKKPGIRSTLWGIEVVDPATGKVLLSVNPERPFLPASVLKVVTTAAALEKLGPGFQFRTSVYASGHVNSEGVLEGDLVLVGRGDPNLTGSEGNFLDRPALQELAEKLQAMGIREIEGDIVGDDSYFDTRTHGQRWTSQDLRTFYGAPVSALGINNNVVWIHARPTKTGQRVHVSADPPSSYFSFQNSATTGKAKSKKTIHARAIPGTRKVVVSGNLPAGRSYSHYVLVERPAEFAAALLKEELRRCQVSVTGGVRAIHFGDIALDEREAWNGLAEHLSPPLVRALEIINKRSENLHAEMLLRVLGAEFRGVGTDELGVQVVRDFLMEAGIDDNKVSLRDGSGLSRENLLTPRFQTSLMLYLSRQSYFDLFVNTLAVSGVDGTLKHRLISREVKGAIFAKTGSLNGVAALSGFMTTHSGRNLVFSIFANNARASMTRIRKTIDEICSLLVNLY